MNQELEINTNTMTRSNQNQLLDKTKSFEARKPVLFAVDSYFPTVAGAERQAMVLAKALRERGVMVEFVAPRLREEPDRIEYVEGFKLTRIRFPRIRIIGAIWFMIVFSVFVIRNRQVYSCVHVHITKLLAASLGITKPLHRLKVVAKVSGHAEFTGGFLDQTNRFNFAYKIMRHFIKKLDHIQTISKYTRTVLLDNGFSNDQILQISNAVDISLYEYGRPEHSLSDDGKIRIGFCGRIEKVKGLEVLIDAIATIEKPDLQKIEIHIAGEGDDEPVLKALISEKGLEEQFEFHGVVEDVPAFLNTLDIYTQPSFAEGLSNSVLEAMSAGLPVVASRISGNIDLVEEGSNGFLFSSGDHLQLADCLSRLLHDPAQRRRLGLAGREKIVNHYSTQVVINKLIGLYFDEQE